MPKHAPHIAALQQSVQRIGRLADQVFYATEQTGIFFRGAPDPCCVATKTHFLLVNVAWTAVLGWSQEEMKGRPWMDFVHPADIERTAAAAAQMDGRPTVHFENRYLCRDGSYRRLEWATSAWDVHGFAYCIARDVTELRP